MWVPWGSINERQTRSTRSGRGVVTEGKTGRRCHKRGSGAVLVRHDIDRFALQSLDVKHHYNNNNEKAMVTTLG